MWDSGWDDVFARKAWGSYPPEELVRFIGRHYFSLEDRSMIRILEIGCGAGANLIFLCQEGFDVVGVDGSKVGLEQAARRLEARGLEATLECCDAMDLPFEENCFDAVIDVECIYANNLEDSRIILSEAFRVLKAGGKLFSKAFKTGTSGQETGVSLPDEPLTFTSIPDGHFNTGYGIIRLTSETQIPDLYGRFDSLEWDFVIRSDRNRCKEVHEWIITGEKT